jgi:acyl-CoA thioesterase I
MRFRVMPNFPCPFLVVLFGLVGLMSPVSAQSNAPRKDVPLGAVLVLGDSIAAGYGVEKDAAFPTVLQRRIDEAHLPFEVVNAGVSGDTTAGGLRRIDWVLKRPVDYLIIELGGNDGLRGIPPAETEKNLVGIIGRARRKRPGIRIVLAGMQMPQNMGPEYTREFESVFPRVAEQEKVRLIPFLLEGVGGVAEWNQADQIHPNEKGHERVADNVWAVLNELLSPPGK